MRVLAFLLALLCLAEPAWAGELAVRVRDASGKPVPNAVVMVKPQAGWRMAARAPGPYRMAQKDMKFDPFVLVVPVGAEVSFPNLDPVRHHVYSFSPAKTFELKLYSKGLSPAVRFDQAGVVAVGCNIHDGMSAYIRVSDTPYYGKTGPDGAVVIRDLPAGAASVAIWHPYLKARGDVIRQTVIPGAGSASLAADLDLRKPRVSHGGY